MLLLGELCQPTTQTLEGFCRLRRKSSVSVPEEELLESKLTTARIWETGTHQQSKPILNLQVGLHRAIMTWL